MYTYTCTARVSEAQTSDMFDRPHRENVRCLVDCLPPGVGSKSQITEYVGENIPRGGGATWIVYTHMVC